MIKTLEYLVFIEIIGIIINGGISLFKKEIFNKVLKGILSLIIIGITYEMIINNINYAICIIFFIFSIFFVFIDTLDVFNSFIDK